MLVNLKNAWFDPSATYNSPDDNPHEFPDEWEKLLPASAEKLTAKEAKAVKAAVEEAE